MKKHLHYLIAVACFLSFSQVQASDFLLDVNKNSAGAINTSEMENINNFRVDKSYVQSLDDVTKDEQIYDATVEENYAREGSIYNPHFLLEKINFEGNTVKDIKESDLQNLALEVLGEDIYFDELLEVCSNFLCNSSATENC